MRRGAATRKPRCSRPAPGAPAGDVAATSPSGAGAGAEHHAGGGGPRWKLSVREGRIRATTAAGDEDIAAATLGLVAAESLARRLSRHAPARSSGVDGPRSTGAGGTRPGAARNVCGSATDRVRASAHPGRRRGGWSGAAPGSQGIGGGRGRTARAVHWATGSGKSEFLVGGPGPGRHARPRSAQPGAGRLQGRRDVPRPEGCARRR